MRRAKTLLASGLVGFWTGLAIGTLALLTLQVVALTPALERQSRWYIPLAKMTYNLFFRETPLPSGFINDGWFQKITVIPVPSADEQ